MDSVQETPAKRRRVETGYATTSLAYDSQDDSGDNVFHGFETVATIPIQRPLTLCTTPEPPHSPSTDATQPTQIINRETSGLDHRGRKPSIVQVPASSPSRMLGVSSPTQGHGGKLANVIAPAGTAFRPPVVVKSVVIDLSDEEGPTYRGGSSEDELQRSLRIDIKPSTFIQSAQRISRGNTNVPSSSSGHAARFKEITSNSFYKPFETSKAKSQGSTLSGSVYDSRNRDESHTTSRFTTASKRSADVMANSYGGSSRSAKQIRSSQTTPAKALPVEDDLTLDDIEDDSLRRKIERIQSILPQQSIASCKNALVQRKANYEDALDFLISQDTQPGEIDLTVSDNDQSLRQSSKPKKLSAKQQIKAPVQSIQERWTATQSLSKGTQPLSPPPIVPKPRRRLIQGRRQPSPVQRKPSPPLSKILTTESDDSDSGLGPEPEEDVEIENKVLDFLNTCSVPDLVDIAAVSDELATTLLSQTPFRNLEQARQTTKVSTMGTKKISKRAIGDKIVDKCIDMWTGYEAVDSLVRQCEALGKPIAEEMKKWGVDIFGAAKEGELELVNFDRVPGQGGSEASTRDSGIGTPNSLALSADENNDSDGKAMFDQSKKPFFPQPQIMGKGVVLKDYQVVGVNWLNLLFQKNLSCILADDMGLGKTCQVIAFLAHLFENGIKGPHLVVVPGSTLENWLREFSIFCPNLSVMPYYGKILLHCYLQSD